MDQLELFADEPFCLRVTIEDAIRIFWDNYWCHLPSAKTTRSHFERIKQFFRGFYLDTISKADIERFRRHLKEMGYSEPSINKHHMIVSRIFRKFEEYKEGKFLAGTDLSRITLPAKNPASQVPKVNEQKYARRVFITPEQKKVLCGYADDDLCEIIKGLYWTMLRPCDFFAITDKNIDIDKRVIFGIQHKTITTKNPSGVPFKVSIPDQVFDVVRRRLECTKPGTSIFRKTNLQKRWNRVRQLAGMPWVQLRDLRGSAASYLLDTGFDQKTVIDSLGHTTARMLPVYDKRTDERLARATAELAKN